MNSGPGLPACWEWMPGGSELREKDALTGREGVKVGRYFLEEANRYVGDRTEGQHPMGTGGWGSRRDSGSLWRCSLVSCRALPTLWDLASQLHKVTPLWIQPF